MEKSTDQKYNIICLSNQLWDFPSWTNKRHVMTRLAKGGHSVLFVDPPINTGFVFLRQVLRGLWGFVRIITQKKKDSTGAFVYTPLNIIPFTKLTGPLHAARIRKIAKKLFDPTKKTLLWIYHVELPELGKYLGVLDYDLLIYDCVDNYCSFPRYDTPKKKEWIKQQEKRLAERADIIFASAPLLVDKLKTFNDHVFFTPNVGDYGKFVGAKNLRGDLPADIKDIARPRVGYIGALDPYKFDYDLMDKVTTDYPDYSFIIIGQMALKDKDSKGSRLSSKKNVHLLGFRDYKTIERYYAGFDVNLIPYVLNDYTVGGCFPVKFHDALATGVPTIVTDLPAYAPFKDVCYVSKTYDEFSANVKKALEEDNKSKVVARQAVAKENNWDGKVTKMLEHVSDAFSRS